MARMLICGRIEHQREDTSHYCRVGWSAYAGVGSGLGSVAHVISLFKERVDGDEGIAGGGRENSQPSSDLSDPSGVTAT